MRNPSLHAILREFAADSALALTEQTRNGVEVPFEVVEADRGRGRAPLYCYRPLTGSFIRERLGLLVTLRSYAAASRALGGVDGTEAYLRLRDEPDSPVGERERADAVLRCLLARVFEERSEFELDDARFETAYAELERTLYEGRFVTTVIAPLIGIAIDATTSELPLGDGLSLMRGTELPGAPEEAVWGYLPRTGDGGRDDEPRVLLVLAATHERGERSPLALARSRFRRVLTALRLFERGAYALGPMMWSRVDAGPWRAIPLATGGRGARRRLLTLVPAPQEDELRAFCSLIARRMPSSGEVAWALGRYELGCERGTPFEALTDYLLALRALLEPEGPASGRLAQRLAAICAAPEQRAALAERVAHAISLERAVIQGLAAADASPSSADELVGEVAEHLRALLRDLICGHLDSDVCNVADELLLAGAA
jgi:hypothetical protein